jgi:hypothetical protein
LVVGVEEKLIPVSMVVDARLIPFVIPAAIAPELVILNASVTTIELPEEVSALSKSSKLPTAASVLEEPLATFCILAAVSVLPAIAVFCLYCRSSPTIDPVLTAVVAWLLLTVRRSEDQAVLAPELLVEVRFSSLPLVRELAVMFNTFGFAPVAVSASTALLASFEETATTSFAVVGERVVVALFQ